MLNPINRHLPIPGTYNIRDLGGYATRDGSQTQWRRVLRADSLHRLGGAGVDALIGEGLGTIIDLRHAGELAAAPNPFRAREGISYVNISLFENLAPGPEMAAAHDGNLLLGLYVRALKARREAIRDVLLTIADAGEGTVLFHCTAGKDRTGIIAALALLVAKVGHQQILDDYALTATMIAPMLEGLIDDAAARGVDPEGFKPLLAAEPTTMSALLAHIDTDLGGVHEYLDTIGIDTKTRAKLRARLLDPARQTGA